MFASGGEMEKYLKPGISLDREVVISTEEVAVGGARTNKNAFFTLKKDATLKKNATMKKK